MKLLYSGGSDCDRPMLKRLLLIAEEIGFIEDMIIGYLIVLPAVRTSLNHCTMLMLASGRNVVFESSNSLILQLTEFS